MRWEEGCAGCGEFSELAGHCVCNCDFTTCPDPAHDPQCDGLTDGNPAFRRCGCRPGRCSLTEYSQTVAEMDREGSVER